MLTANVVHGQSWPDAGNACSTPPRRSTPTTPPAKTASRSRSRSRAAAAGAGCRASTTVMDARPRSAGAGARVLDDLLGLRAVAVAARLRLPLLEVLVDLEEVLDLVAEL